MKKLVMILDLHDNKDKKKAMQAVSGISGVYSLAIDMKEKKLTLIGDMDPVEVANKLRKLCHADLLTVGEDKDGDKKEGEKKDHLKELDYISHQYNLYNYASRPYYYRTVVEECPPNCVIC